MKTMTKKAIVAFSGGLDTSMLVPYMKDEYGIEEIVTCTVDTGGMSSEEVDAVKKRAKEVGSNDHIHVEAAQEFYDEIIKYLIFGNISRDGYPLCVGAERLIQARGTVQIAREKGIDLLVHGSTGAGNDQYRFDLVGYVLGQADASKNWPAIKVMAPVREHGIKREFSQNYLRERQIAVSEKTAYSYNVGLWGVSIGGKETHTSDGLIPEEAWYGQIDPNVSAQSVEIVFEKGEPVSLKSADVNAQGPLEVVRALARLGARLGIGRHYHTGTSIPGKKGRLAYESPAADILYEAHSALEKATLTQPQIFFKKTVATEFGRLIHEAKFFDPLLDDLKAFLESSQNRVSGKCTVHLKPGHIEAVAVNTPYDLLTASGSVYGEYADFYSAKDAEGSSRINAYEQVIYRGVKG
jgi:argininosuccinate synthase